MTANSRDTGSDLVKVDAYVNDPLDYAEIPELIEEDFARGILKLGGVAVKRGRPAPNGAKQQITLRLDPSVIDGFKATGPGWQGRINAALREWLAKHAA